MDIPLKSRPKVSMVNLIDDSKFNIAGNTDNSVIAPGWTEEDENDTEHAGNYKLTRTYSDSEKSNFDAQTGHRLYDDGKIRPQMSRSNSHAEIDGANKIYSRSHNQLTSDKANYFTGLEDEYVPGLDFSILVYKWNGTSSSHNLSNMFNENGADSNTNSIAHTPSSNDGSYLDLNKLHAQVAPQPIRLNSAGANKYSFSKLSDLIRLRTPRSQVSAEQTPIHGDFSKNGENKNKRKISAIVDPATGDINYEMIIDNLPPNFNELPYSQRKKLVKSFSESIDYSQFSLFAKQYLNEKSGSGNKLFRSSSSGENSQRRSRRNSTNTVAGRLLALSSATDLKKLPEQKHNVDEKDAIVMDHVLGKIIGFGAWGTIRECTAPDGTIRAVKIVKSWRGMESGPHSKYDYVNLRHHNPKVLRIFKKEIAIWDQLRHENVLPLIDHLEAEDIIFCLTERITGGTLFEVITDWGIYNQGLQNSGESYAFSLDTQESRLQTIIAFAKQITEALYYLHELMGVVHGDIKSENILVDNSDPNNRRIVLCDFGMSRVFSSRPGRNSPRLFDKDADMKRSRSSMAEVRKPYDESSPSLKNLFHDDSKIGISDLSQRHGPSPQSLSWTDTSRAAEWSSYYEKCKVSSQKQLESFKVGLPHSHIGSLPYASPELLLPSPPPLGPSADIWALGALLYTMIVGKLPFQHLYEPRLRATISSGKYNKDDLKRACLLRWVAEKDSGSHGEDLSQILSQSISDSREQLIEESRLQWLESDRDKYKWMYELVTGCLEVNITKRLDIVSIRESMSAATAATAANTGLSSDATSTLVADSSTTQSTV